MESAKVKKGSASFSLEWNEMKLYRFQSSKKIPKAHKPTSYVSNEQWAQTKRPIAKEPWRINKILFICRTISRLFLHIYLQTVRPNSIHKIRDMCQYWLKRVRVHLWYHFHVIVRNVILANINLLKKTSVVCLLCPVDCCVCAKHQ